jgi:2-phospho-L-lactate guanylyltransferase
MSIWALVPIKARAECKGRLRDDLDPRARQALARAMLQHVVGEALRSRNVDRLIVVSPERDTLPPEIALVVDQGSDLNAAIRLGRDHALTQGARALLVLAADLPVVTAAEIDAFVALGRNRRIAIATDRAGTGTNALYVGNPQEFEFGFGANSRWRHEHEARRHGIWPAQCVLPGLAADLDTARDLEKWSWVGGWSIPQALAGVGA